MKTKIFLTACILFFFTAIQLAFAQKQKEVIFSGVYLTPEDFKNGVQQYSINCKTEKHKIKLYDFFKKQHLEVVHNDTVYKLKRSEVYGFQLCDGKVYRFYKEKDYTILNPKEEILIYLWQLPPVGKAAGRKEYYFSKDYQSDLVPLTIDNLKKAFPDNHKFHDLIDSHFTSDAALTWFDDYHSLYKINHLLKSSLQ